MKRVLVLITLAMLASGCSIKQVAVNSIGNALSDGGGVWMSDNDPELVKAAIPFGLKMNESLLEVSPDHRGLLQATAQGFSAYAFLLKEEADRAAEDDLQKARKLRARSSRLFMRGRDYALHGLEVRFPGFTDRLKNDLAAALAATDSDDAGLLYWAGASWAGALSTAKDNLVLVQELPTAAALVGRVLELDDTYGLGSAHEFFVAYEAGRPGGSREVARDHYRRALELSGGERASVHLALAESVSVAEQDLGEFRDMLTRARAIDPEATPETRLLNIIARERADWLAAQLPELFLEAQ